MLKVATLNIKKGMLKASEINFEKAKSFIHSSKGNISHNLLKSMHDENKYLLPVNWRYRADHEIGFRKFNAYKKWSALLHHFYELFPTFEYYR